MAADFLRAFLEENPDILYGAMRPQQGSWNFLDYWRRQQGDVYGDYLAGLGRTALGGQEPTQTFGGFLGNYPFLSNYLGLPPQERGEYPSRFSPRLRWNLGNL